MKLFDSELKIMDVLWRKGKTPAKEIADELGPVSYTHLVARIEQAMAKRQGQNLELTNRVDPRLISGIKVVIGNEVIDGSMKSKIESLKSELLKESR